MGSEPNVAIYQRQPHPLGKAARHGAVVLWMAMNFAALVAGLGLLAHRAGMVRHQTPPPCCQEAGR